MGRVIMKTALISPNELVYSYDGTYLGERVAQVTTQPFDIAPPLFWVPCADNVVPDQFYWDGNACIAIPTPPLAEPNATTTGTGGPTIVA